VDMQLQSALDHPQLEYFQLQSAALKAGDRVILVTPEPSWIDESERLAYLQRGGTRVPVHPRFQGLRTVETLVADSLATLVVVLAGDKHHYARYAGNGTDLQRITFGGGGAFLLGTHDLPEALSFEGVTGKETPQLVAAFPSARISRQLRWFAIALPARSPVFCMLLASLYLLYEWVLQSASKVPHPTLGNRSLIEYYAAHNASGPSAVTDVLLAWIAVLAHSPVSVMLTVLVMLGCGAFTGSGLVLASRRGWIAGAAHGLCHVALALFLLWGIGVVNLGHIGLDPDSLAQVLLFIVEVVAVGGLIGGLLFGTWMAVTNKLFGWHDLETLSSQSIADFKGFLRLHVAPDALTIYPIGLRRVCRRWALGRGIIVLHRVGSRLTQRVWRLLISPDARERFVPRDPLQPELIESPIVVPSQATVREHS